jgi:hypothetical protein
MCRGRYQWFETHRHEADSGHSSVQELAAQQKRILLRDEQLYIQQLAPKAYVSPLFTRQPHALDKVMAPSIDAGAASPTAAAPAVAEHRPRHVYVRA